MFIPSDEVVLAHVVKTEEEDRKAKELLEAFAQKIGTDTNVDVKILYGDLRSEIEKFTSALHPDFMVIGTRGLTGIKKAFLGSNAEYFAQHLTVPVVIVH
ncbi:hypothetical protein HDU91_002862 [Kappamyces sp. JEL0680]|nr:hypothetical protein HDU91_002862 [Kappamyces sp. JEL0680]